MNTIPEQTHDLLDADGSIRIRLVAQIWLLENQAYLTSFTLAVMAPEEFTDDDCQWLANKIKEMLRESGRAR